MHLQKLFLIGLMSAINVCAFAIPAKRGVRTYAQADGSTISLELIGDENFHTLVTTDRLPVSLGSDGNYYYTTSTGVSDVVAHNVSQRTAAEASFISSSSDDLSVESLVKAAQKSGALRVRKGEASRVATQVPVTDSPKIPIILVQYSDVSFKDSDPLATFKSFFSSGSTSAYQYFVDQSNGKYTPQFDVYGPVTLTKTRETYGANDSSGSDVGVGTMVGEACNLIDSSIDFSQYDNDGDGTCDVVIVLYAGVGEASSSVSNSIWPCQWDLRSSDYGKTLKLDSTTISKFAVFNELYGSDTSKIDGVGTFCHEFSHCMGLPDFYETTYANGYFGMGAWSLMDYGSYNNNGYTPCGYSAYEKNYMGWIDLPEATENTQYTLPIFNQKDASTDVAVKITNTKDSNEYYVLENRAQQGWDKYLSAEGMMVTHVTYSSTVWTNNTVNNTSTQRMTIIPADNSLSDSDLAGDLWPYNGATELTNSSTPAATVYTGSYMSKPITEITKNTDGTVSLWFMKAAAQAIATPTNLAAKVDGADSATISWAAGDDTAATYTLEVTQHRDAAAEPFVSTDFTTGTYGGWTKSSSGTAITTTNGVQLASNKNAGTLTSPSFTTGADGKVTVVINSKYYDSGSSLTVSLSTGASTTITPAEDFADYTVVLAGTADTSTTVTLKAASGKRVYVKNVTIYDGDKSSAPARVTETSSEYTRTFSGITETSYQVTGLSEETLYDYRVKAVPTDTEAYLESEWTEYSQFTTEAGEIVIRAVAAPKSPAAKVESTTSATLSWEAGEDVAATYSVELLKDGDDTATTITGISETSTLAEGLDAEAAYQFRVKAVPTDTERYTESEWSDYASFNLEDGIVVVALATPTNTVAKVNAINSATISWEAGDDNAATYTLELTKQVEATAYELVSTTDFSAAANYSSWTTSGYTASENSTLRLGSGSKIGSVTSPAFTTAEDGVVTVKLNAKYYNTDASSVKVSLLSGSSYGTTDATETVELTSAFADYYIVLSGSAKTSVKVKIESLASSKRVVLSSVSLYTGDASKAASAAKVADSTVDGVRTISGIEETSITLSDLDEEATYSYRVMANPTDSKRFADSQWTEAKEFTLEGDIEVKEVAAPTSLTASDITTSTATLTWAAGDTTDVTYTIELGKEGETANTVTGISATSYAAEGLDSETTYEFRVKAVPTDISRYSDSQWSEKTQFTTAIEVETIETPENVTSDKLSATSATIYWAATEGYDVTYSVELTKEKSAGATYELVSTTSFTDANHGWTTSSNGIGSATSGTGLQIGSGSYAGSVTSPAFTTAEDGVVTVKFNAKSYGSDASSVKVSLLSGSSYDTTDASETIALTTDFADYTIVFQGSAETSVKVKVETLAKKKRIYLMSVSLYTGDASAAEQSVAAKAPTVTTDGNVTLVEGIEDTQYTFEDLEEGATYSYRVKVVPVDAEHYAESEWSESSSFTLDREVTGVDTIATEGDADAVYYNLQGVRVENPSTGLYIRRQGNTVTKIVKR